jgi:phosphoenolpyruvate synthase/pyruvate phosphate dikinase
MLVPAGFHVTTTAYRRFVTENGLQEQILSAVSAVAADQPATLEEASKQIVGLFAQSAMPDDLEVPRIPLSRWRMQRTFVPEEIHLRQREAKAHMYIFIEGGEWKP